MPSLRLITKLMLFLTGCVIVIFYMGKDVLQKQKSWKMDERQRMFFANQSNARQKILQSYLNAQNEKKDFGPFYNAIVPEIVCQWLARVGNVDDGGKWTCNPWALPENCLIYSLGVGHDITFETEMDKIVEQRCKIYSFDPDATLGKRLVDKKSERFVFRPFKISQVTNITGRKYSINDLMRKFDHTFVDFLKIDIEKSEFTTLPAMLAKRTRPIACQIFIEMHGTPFQCATLLSRLSKAGFWLFYYERNGRFPRLSEYSFMHESCFARFGVTNILTKNFPQ